MELMRRLNEAEVRFLIIGGIAMWLHGSNRDTVDIDMLYARDDENLRLIVEALKPLEPRLRGALPNIPFIFDARTLKMGQNFTFQTKCGDVDLLADVGVDDDFEALWERSVPFVAYGIPVRAVSLDDLIKMKKVAGREKDRGALSELMALKKLREEEQS